MCSVSCCCGTVAQIETKGAAIALALMMATSYCEAKNTRRTNYKKAQRIFDFICSNVNLPDVKTSGMAQLEPMVRSMLEELRFHRPEKNEG